MFISKQNGQLYMVRHDEHMIHTGDLAGHWAKDWFDDPQIRTSFIEAMQKHDLGWKQADDEVLFDADKGQPLNFMHVDLKRHIQFYGESYRTVLEYDQWAGLLIGMHWIGLYTGRFGYEPALRYQTSDPDLKDTTILHYQKEWIDIKHQLWNQDAGARREFEDRIWKHYELFQLLDKMSILICMNDLNMKKEATLGPIRVSGSQDYFVPKFELTGNGEVKVTPYPFEQEFEAAVPVRKIPDKLYSSHQELQETYYSNKPERLICRVIGG